MWKKLLLGDTCYISSGNSIPKKKKEMQIKNVKGTPYIATKDISFDGKINYTNGVHIPKDAQSKFKKSISNATLICAEGGSAGRKIAFSSQECCYGNKLFSISAKKDLLPKFLYYYTLGSEFQKQFKKSMNGLIGGVSLSKIKEFTISYPSIDDQKFIIKKIDQCFNKTSTLISLTEDALINQSSFVELTISDIFRSFATNSKILNLIDLCDKNRGITYGVIKLGKEVIGGVPCLRTSNVRSRYITTNVMKRISKEISSEYSRTILRGNEVLVNVRGTLGGVAVANKNMQGWNISREVALVPIITKLINPNYVALFISSKDAQKWLSNNTKGAAYKGINLEDLRTMPIPYLEMDAQDKVVKKIEQLNRLAFDLKSSYIQKIDNLLQLRKRLLDQEFQKEAA